MADAMARTHGYHHDWQVRSDAQHLLVECPLLVCLRLDHRMARRRQPMILKVDPACDW